MTEVQKRLSEAATEALPFHEKLASELDADLARRYKTRDFHFTPAQIEEMTTRMMESEVQMLKVCNLAEAWIREKS